MNNVIYLIIGPKYILNDLCKYTLLVIYNVIFKYFIMYGITFFDNGCDNLFRNLRKIYVRYRT